MTINSSGVRLYKRVVADSSGATSDDWEAYAGVLNLEFSGIERESIQVASIDLGLRKSYIPGYRDSGMLMLSLNYEKILIKSLKADYDTEDIFDFKVEFPDATFFLFSGFIVSMPVKAQIGSQIIIDVQLQITTDIEISDGPVITLVGDSVVTIVRGSTYTDAGATAVDTEDGDLTSDIVVTNTVNTGVDGTYYVYYNVEDDDENAANQKVRTVIVVAPLPITVISEITSTSVKVTIDLDGIDVGNNTKVGFVYSDYDTTPEFANTYIAFTKLIDLEEGVVLYEHILTETNDAVYPGRTFYLRAFLAKINYQTFEYEATYIDTVKTYDIPLGNFADVDTKPARNITSSSATLVLDLILKGTGGTILAHYFNWGIEPHTLSTGSGGSSDFPIGEKTFNLNYGLSAGTTYYCRARVQTSVGWSYGEVQSFTTLT
jgi:hypothetical protein